MAPPSVGCSMVSRRTAACQYGSRAALAISVGRQAVPRETSSPREVMRPLWQATQRVDGSKSAPAGAGAACAEAKLSPSASRMLSLPRQCIPSGVDSPAFIEASVVPIPKEIAHRLHRSSCHVIHWHQNAEVGAHVSALAYGQLNLGHEVPQCCCFRAEYANGLNLEHRNPKPTKARIGEHAAQSNATVELPGSSGLVERQRDSTLQLYEAEV